MPAIMSAEFNQKARRIEVPERKLSTFMLTAALALLPSAAHAAQAVYPDKPIRLVIGSAAGSGPDIISRVLADRLYKSWHERVVVDARPGVAGILSAELVLRAAADGYTWMMLTSQLMVATSVYPNVKFDLDKDFSSVSLIGTVPFVLLVTPELPAKSIRELIDLAKKQPGMLRYGSAGAGASEHLSGFLFTRLTGTNMLHVPYKGIAQAIADTISKEVHLTFPVLPAALPHVQSGRLRAVGVTTPKRAALLPDVPAIGEVVPGYQMMGWYSIVVPRGTPEPIVAKVAREVSTAVKEPDFGEQLKGLGLEIVGSTRADFDAFRRDQRKRISEIVKASGVDLK
jgi:tripartite-type tricarboxylate transporter receptor subunit TctC